MCMNICSGRPVTISGEGFDQDRDFGKFGIILLDGVYRVLEELDRI